MFIYGGRPFTGGLCKGVEEAMATMKAGHAAEYLHVCRPPLCYFCHLLSLQLLNPTPSFCEPTARLWHVGNTVVVVELTGAYHAWPEHAQSADD